VYYPWTGRGGGGGAHGLPTPGKIFGHSKKIKKNEKIKVLLVNIQHF
jgi:hypothetical protein